MLRAYPRVVLKDQEAVIQIRDTNQTIIKENTAYILRHTCGETYRSDQTSIYTEVISSFEISQSTNRPLEREVISTQDGLSVRFLFEDEQEHHIRIYLKETMEKVGHVNIYSLGEDLYQLRPYKGDLHMHSNRSDGEEVPAIVASECRRVGYDFMALTDHGKYRPSIECREAYEDFNGLLEIYTGEEVHLPYHQAHILNINGNASVNEYFMADKDGYFKEVEKIQEGMDAPPRKVDAYMLAAAKWAFDKIKEYGGMSVYCHPYWKREPGYNQCAALTDAILDRQDFDVFEVISGYNHKEADSNLLQVAKYHELKERGQKLPIVGVSDGHNIKNRVLFSRLYTIVLARSPQFEDVKDAIMSFKSVAIEHLEGENLRSHGDFRIVKYMLFLTREFFPEHDEIAEEEGRLMEQYYSNPNMAKYQEELKQVKDKMELFYATTLRNCM